MAFLAILILLVLAVGLVCGAAERKKYESRFPSISDDKFVELCGPGTNRDVALRVRRIVADQLGVEYDRIHPASSFVNDLGCD